MKCFNCIDTVYMEDMGGGDWKCPVCGDEYNQYTDYDVLADPKPIVYTYHWRGKITRPARWVAFGCGKPSRLQFPDDFIGKQLRVTVEVIESEAS